MTTDNAAPRVTLVDWLQAAEIETHILVEEEDSVRADWWRASCGLHDWYTTGSKPNVEDAAAHHVAWEHTACADVDPDSAADAPLYCRLLPDHDDDHFNGGRTWANDRGPAVAASTTARSASHYFRTDGDRERFLGMVGDDQLDTWFTPEFAHYVRHGVYPAGTTVGQSKAGNVVPATPFQPDRAFYEEENKRLWERAAKADNEAARANLRATILHLVLQSTLLTFSKKDRFRGTRRSRPVPAATFARWQRICDDEGRTAEQALIEAGSPAAIFAKAAEDS